MGIRSRPVKLPYDRGKKHPQAPVILGYHQGARVLTHSQMIMVEKCVDKWVDDWLVLIDAWTNL